MSAPQSVTAKGREHAIQLDANDPLKSFRKEFLIPTKIGSGMTFSSFDSAQYTYWQLQTATMSMKLVSTSAEIL